MMQLLSCRWCAKSSCLPCPPALQLSFGIDGTVAVKTLQGPPVPALIHQKFKMRCDVCSSRNTSCIAVSHPSLQAAAAISSLDRLSTGFSSHPCSPDGSRLKISLKAQQLESEWAGTGGTGGSAVAKQTTTWRRVHA